MKNLNLLLPALALLASCSDGENKSKTVGGTKATSLMQIAGQYDAKLTSNNFKGIDVSLVINPDSSFQFTNIFRRMEQGAKDSVYRLAGKFSIESDFTQLRLKPAGGQGNDVVVLLNDTMSVTIPSPENAESTEKLMRSTRVVLNDPNHRVTYKIAQPDSNQNMVYQVQVGKFVNIHKQFLDMAAPAERAVVAFYASIFNTYCVNGKCDLVTALGFDERNDPEHAALISNHLNADSIKSVLTDLSGKDAKLTTLQLGRSRGSLMATYIVEMPDGMNFNLRDVFGKTPSGYNLISHNSNQMRQMLPGDSSTPAQRRPDAQGDPRRPATREQGKEQQKQERAKSDTKGATDPKTIASPQPLQRTKK